MNLNAWKEEYSYAYIHAVVAGSGYSFQIPPKDLDSAGIDVQISATGLGGVKRITRLEAQVKCTARARLTQTDVIYNLESSDYNQLVDTGNVPPLILIVVVVPDDPKNWTSHSSSELCLKDCGYWVSLHGKAATLNSSSITVNLPITNVFSIVGLQAIMARIAAGALP